MVLMGLFCVRLACEAVLAYVSNLHEKGSYSSFWYGSTQAVRMPRMALNLQFWTCGSPGDRLRDKKKGKGGGICRLRMLI
jgi:hypothetical protein